jgi:F-type H+/Na+-transporting ATPase subunit alpha
VAEQVASIYAGTGGYLDRLKTERVPEFLGDLIGYLKADHGDLMGRIDDGELSDEDEETLGKAIQQAIDDFGVDLDEEGKPVDEGEEPERREERTAGDGDRAEQGEEAGAEGDGAEREPEREAEGDQEAEEEREEVTA